MKNKNKLNLNLILLGLVVASCFSLDISAVKYRWFNAEENARTMVFLGRRLSDHDKDYRRGVWVSCVAEPEVKEERRGRSVRVDNPTSDQRLEALAEESDVMRDALRYADPDGNAFEAYSARLYGIGVLENKIACEPHAKRISTFVKRQDRDAVIAALRGSRFVAGDAGGAVGVGPGDDGR